MIELAYTRATDAADAIRRAEGEDAKYLGGGTNLVDLMRETVEVPSALVDVTGLSAEIEETDDGGLMIGAAARNTAVAEHPAVRTRYPMLTRAIVAGASAQIRNMATVGGNLLQRTRCTYFYDTDGSRCNKRSPGEGCDAIEGFNRIHAILGGSPACVATHPSDMCVALAALDAVVHLRSTSGERTVALCDLHRLPEDRPDVETVLEPGELITAVQLPASDARRAFDLPQGARPLQLRVRARLGRRRARARRRHDRRCAPRSGRGRPQAVAGVARRGGAARPAGDGGQLPCRRPMPSLPTPVHSPATRSRSTSPAARSPPSCNS